jgi:DNA-binding NarL/FixJ family response regulator
MRPRIVIADDHGLFLEGIRLMLQSEFDVVAAVADGRSLLTAVNTLKPDLVLLDISMPLLNGINAARQIKKKVPSAKIMFLTMHEDAEHVADAFRAGASGFISKRVAMAELLSAARQVLDGSIYVSPMVVREATRLVTNNIPRRGNKPEDGPTLRQQEVLQLIAEGKSRKEISAILNISVRTVEFHKSALSRKLHLRSTADFIRYAVEHGMISFDRGHAAKRVLGTGGRPAESLDD